ncbi:MAG: hypothetical protein ABIS45_08030 [Burkholderiales bacterium]
MDTKATRIDIVGGNTETANSGACSKHSRTAAALAVLLIVIMVVAVWLQPGDATKAVSAAHSAQSAVEVPAKSKYFPDQYKNQGTEIPQQIDSF